MDAAYVFAVAFRLDPDGATADPDRFETTVEIPAIEPGDDGWLFFRDRLWRGEIGDEPSFRSLASDRLGVAVTEASFRELRTDRDYLDALEAAIAADLDRFNAESVD
ncbi:MAG: LWR-salt protein [Halorubrum sp.]|uniref:LWR-salt protein n=1 Tax=Halorubrum sp. TaxID=1879286 RepID=UPI003970C8BF